MWIKSSFAIPAVTAISFCLIGGITPASAHADIGDQLFKLLADDGADFDEFGFSVAISGAIAVVGAPNDDDNGDDSGSAYLFETITGRQIAKLLPNDGGKLGLFGYSVAVDGATAIVGSIGDDEINLFSGAAYLFDIADPTNPMQIAKLLADDGAQLDVFGWSVAISGAIAIVGAQRDDDNGPDSGSAYLFDTTTGEQLFKLLPNDGAEDDFFGFSVAISGAIAIVGAFGGDDNGTDSGSAYLFDTTTGRQIAKLLPDDGAADDKFGDSVAISGAIAIVGAPEDDDNGTLSGSAYLFDISDPPNPMQIAKLLADDGAVFDLFGESVAISGATAIVGASEDGDNGLQSGSAYLFGIAAPANPIQIAKLLPDDGAEGDFLGISVAISGLAAIVGAYRDDDNGLQSGSAYLFSAVGSVDFDPPEEFPASGEATVEAVGSFDAERNDTPDLVVVVPGSKRRAQGNVQVFLNQGNDDKTGDWNGLKAGALILVGTDPSDITAGFFNGDPFLDLAVSNAGDNQLSILLGNGIGSFNPGAKQDVGQAPSAVASGQFNLDGFVDLVVANELDDTVSVLFGDGMGGFVPGPVLPTGGRLALLPIGLEPEDLDNDKDLDIAGINQGTAGGEGVNGSVFVILSNGDGTFAPAENYPVGIEPRQLAVAFVDGDTFGDVVVVNGADATVSVLLNNGDGTFGREIVIGVGTSPRSIDAVDLDGDGDPDLVIAANHAPMVPVVEVLVNISSDIGEVEFELPLAFSVNADPNFVASADFNADTQPDIVTANADEGKTGGSVTVLLNDSLPLPKPCPWDLDGSGSVGAADLLDLLFNWGPCPGCAADFDDDDIVGASDLLAMLFNWGPCP